MTAQEQNRAVGQAADHPASPASDTRRRWHVLSHTAKLYLAVAIGSIIGGTARWLMSELLHAYFPDGLPWGTLFVNVTGSFLIGFYAAISGPDGRIFAGPVQRQFVMTGICGGYTTFSVFSLESVRLLEAGQLQLGGLNVAVSLVSWLLAVWSGFALATWWSRLGR
jgi:CrcB protein